MFPAANRFSPPGRSVGADRTTTHRPRTDGADHALTGQTVGHRVGFKGVRIVIASDQCPCQTRVGHCSCW